MPHAEHASEHASEHAAVCTKCAGSGACPGCAGAGVIPCPQLDRHHLLMAGCPFCGWLKPAFAKALVETSPGTCLCSTYGRRYCPVHQDELRPPS